MRSNTFNTLRKFDIIIVAAAFLLLGYLVSFQRTTDFIIFCIFVVSYDLLYGYMGRLSFGHMLYLGAGAYATALFCAHVSGNPLLALLAGIIFASSIGALLGPIIIRTTGACFALINLAFNQVGYFLALIGFSTYTGGEDGMSAFFTDLGFITFNDKFVVYLFCLFCLLVVVYFMRRLTQSPFGMLLLSIKENETRAQFLGYNTVIYKWVAFVISTAIAGLAGGLSTLNYTYVTPSFIDPTRNVEVIFASLIGGAGSVYGALVGGVTYMMISNYLPNYVQRWEMFLGIMLLILVFWFRAGVWGYLISLTDKQGKETSS
jgi:branched-chain amino acid transport system permease protein